MRTRRAFVVLALSLATGTAACGDAPPAPPRSPVALTLSAPMDGATTREASVLVSGSVAPAGSRVLILGRPARVSGGRFSAAVDLREGTNVIDVGASAPGARATWLALRVIRRSRIRLPDVTGRETPAATAALEALGFDVRVSVDDDLFDAFRRGPRLVCRTDPAPESLLRPAGDIELVVSKTC